MTELIWSHQRGIGLSGDMNGREAVEHTLKMCWELLHKHSAILGAPEEKLPAWAQHADLDGQGSKQLNFT